MTKQYDSYVGLDTVQLELLSQNAQAALTRFVKNPDQLPNAQTISCMIDFLKAAFLKKYPTIPIESKHLLYAGMLLRKPQNLSNQQIADLLLVLGEPLDFDNILTIPMEEFYVNPLMVLRENMNGLNAYWRNGITNESNKNNIESLILKHGEEFLDFLDKVNFGLIEPHVLRDYFVEKYIDGFNLLPVIKQILSVSPAPESASQLNIGLDFRQKMIVAKTFLSATTTETLDKRSCAPDIAKITQALRKIIDLATSKNVHKIRLQTFGVEFYNRVPIGSALSIMGLEHTQGRWRLFGKLPNGYIRFTLRDLTVVAQHILNTFDQERRRDPRLEDAQFIKLITTYPQRKQLTFAAPIVRRIVTATESLQALSPLPTPPLAKQIERSRSTPAVLTLM